RPAAQMVGGPQLPPGTLALVNEPEARHEEGEHAGGLEDGRWEDGGSARLVVILQKARRAALILQISGEEAPDSASALGVQAIVEALVVGVIEPLLLECPLQVPVCLGHEQEARLPPAHVLDGRRPEWRVDRRTAVARKRAIAPGARDDVGQDQHGHVAADAVALAGDALE